MNRAINVIEGLIAHHIYRGSAFSGPASVPSQQDLKRVRESLGVYASKFDLLWVSRSPQAALQFSDGDLSEIKESNLKGGIVLIEDDDKLLVIKPESLNKVKIA